MNELASDPIAEPSPVCAILYLHGLNQQRFVFVFGQKRKHEFKWSETHGKIVKEYTSPAQFAADELDIRVNPMNRYVVCTLMGSPNPVTAAKEGVAALIVANRSVGSPARRAALAEIVETAQAAITAIDAPPPDEETGASQLAAPVPPPPAASSLDKGIPPEFQKQWQDAATGVPIDVPPVNIIAGVPVPVGTKGRHAHAELMDGEVTPMETLRAIAKDLGISLHKPSPGGTKSRPMLADEILAAEQRKAA